MAKTAPQQLSFQQTVDRIIQHLDAPDDASIAVSCATLCMMLSQSQEQVDLGGLAAKLLKLLQTQDSLQIQRNAVAALSAAVEANDVVLQEALESKAAAALVQRLQQQGVSDLGLAANLLAGLGALAEGSLEGAQSVVDAGGVELVLERCSQAPAALEGQQQEKQAQEQLQEAVVDVLCKLLGHTEGLRAVVAEKGGVSGLAALLCSSGSPDVKVRCLLGLGMLVGGQPERQVQLAAAPGAAAQLVALMRQGDDGDCQHIAANIFGELARNPAAKECLTGALKDAQQ